jgi:hypothetical protein
VDECKPLTPGARHLARKLTELGWLFRRIRSALGGSGGGAGGGFRGGGGGGSGGVGTSTPSLGGAAAGDGGGSTRQAFRAAVQAGA